MKRQRAESGWLVRTFRSRVNISRRGTSLFEIRARLGRLLNLQRSILDQAALPPIHDVTILDSRYQRFSSIICFKYSGICGNGSNLICIEPSAAFEMIVFTLPKRSFLSG